MLRSVVVTAGLILVSSMALAQAPGASVEGPPSIDEANQRLVREFSRINSDLHRDLDFEENPVWGCQFTATSTHCWTTQTTLNLNIDLRLEDRRWPRLAFTCAMPCDRELLGRVVRVAHHNAARAQSLPEGALLALAEASLQPDAREACLQSQVRFCFSRDEGGVVLTVTLGD